MELPDRNLQASSPVSLEPGSVLLETDRLIVRRFSRSDAAEMAIAGNHREIFNSLRDRYPFPYTLAEAEAFLSRHTDPAKQTVYPSTVALVAKPDTPGGKPYLIGSIGARPGEDINYRSWEMGYWLTPSAWGKGYATEAVSAFTKWLFATWPKLNRVEAEVYSNNPKSMAVLTKVGFTREGAKRASAEKCGELVDEVIFGFLRSDLQK